MTVKDTKFDELRVQLELGKAEGLDAFKEQKKGLLAKLHEIEVNIKTNKCLNDIYAFVLLEIEKFKLKLEVLEQKRKTRFIISKKCTKNNNESYATGAIHPNYCKNFKTRVGNY